MDNLRLILILIGLVVLALIWLLHRPEGQRRPGASRRDARREPELAESPAEPPAGETPRQATLPEIGEAAPVEPDRPKRREPVLGAIAGETAKAETVPPEDQWREEAGVSQAAARETIAAGTESESPRIVTLYLRARGDRRISGLSLLDAAIKAGLRFGEMKIFHRRHRGATRPVFSMANITRPGSFDPSGWNLFETPGVTLFLTLPGPVSALDAWDAMLATGQRLATILDADLMDDSHCLLTRQRIAQIREEMREFDRRHGLGS